MSSLVAVWPNTLVESRHRHKEAAFVDCSVDTMQTLSTGLVANVLNL